MWMMLEGAGILLAGMGLGRVWPARRRGPKKSIEPNCGCEHDLALHDQQTGKCHGIVTRPHYMKSGERLGKEHVPCTCRQYTGPEPLTTYYAPELTGLEDR